MMHRLYHCPEWKEVRNQMPDDPMKWEQQAVTSNEEWTWQKRTVAAYGREAMPLSEKVAVCRTGRGLVSEGFRDHVATDGSFMSVLGKWRACGWSDVQLDYDGELAPRRGVYGSMEVKGRVQRPTKTAVCCKCA